MRTLGIIVEYNPLHNGHVYHFRQARIVSEADAVVAVMSGHYLQRGEPALVNKWARSEMALRMGADLVIELPVIYSAQPAPWFAYGAVSALHASGVVDCLCFGSESGDMEWLNYLADLLADEPEPLQTLLAEHLKKGASYPAAYAQAVQAYVRTFGETAHRRPETREEPDGETGVPDKPNDMLGLQYLIALRKLNSRIMPYTIARTKAGYHDPHPTDAHIASATAIRRMLLSEGGTLEHLAPYVPPYTLDILRREMEAGRAPVDWERFASHLFHSLLSRTREELASFAEVTEGLENRMKRALAEMKNDLSVGRFIELCKTKRYTRTKLQRAMTHILLNHRRDMLSGDLLAQGVPYLRVLGFSRTGQALLKRMKRSSSVPIILNVGRNVHPTLALDIRATGIYALGYRTRSSRDLLRDYYEPPICLDEVR